MLQRLAPAALVALLAWAATAPASAGGFVYDDHHYVLENPAVSGSAPIWSSPLGEPVQGLWRPLTVASWWLQWAPGGGAGPFLAANIALHVLCAVLVLALALRLGAGLLAATVAASLFAVHPVHAEAVAWVSGRSELLATGLVLAAWWAHMGAGRAAVAGSALLMALAGLSKENALVAPALFLAGDVLLRRRPLPWARLTLLFVVAGGLLVVRALVVPVPLPAHGPFLDAPLVTRLGVACNVVGLALRLLAWPDPLRVEYHQDELALPRTELLVAAVALVALAAWLRRRQPLAATALLLLPVALAPVLHLLPIGEPFAERFLYLPSVPFCLALGVLLAAWLEREWRSRRGLGTALLATTALVLAALPTSRSAVAVFHDEVALWRQAVAAAPRLALPRYNLGRALLDQGRVLTEDAGSPGALDLLASSLALEPRHAYAGLAHQMLGDAALGLLGAAPPDPQGAARHFREAVALLPGLVDARLRLGEIATLAPHVVPPAEAMAALEPLRARTDLEPAQRLRLDGLLDQLTSRPPSPPPSSEGPTGTSSPDGS